MKLELSNAITQNKPLSAYLFCGAQGSGKKTAALAFAAALVGSKKALKSQHPDVIFVTADEGKQAIAVKTIREMRLDAFITPTEALKKVYIIDGEMRDDAQNALLTILEQPPSFSIFIILATTKEQLLPTVLSRCSIYQMEDVGIKEGIEHLKSTIKNVDDDTLKTCMVASGGNLGLAKKMATDKQFKKYIDDCQQLVKSAALGDIYFAYKYMSKLKKDSVLEFLQVLTMYMRDLLIYASTSNTSSLAFENSILQNRDIFDKIKVDAVYCCLDALGDAMRQTKASISARLIIADLVTIFGGLNS